MKKHEPDRYVRDLAMKLEYAIDAVRRRHGVDPRGQHELKRQHRQAHEAKRH